MVYRIDSAQLLDRFWSRVSYDDNIAALCVPGTADANSLLDLDWMDLRYSTGRRAAAERYGWIYNQRYGGGSDEHTAVFTARDAELTQRVYRYAQAKTEQQIGGDRHWWLCGMA